MDAVHPHDARDRMENQHDHASKSEPALVHVHHVGLAPRCAAKYRMKPVRERGDHMKMSLDSSNWYNKTVLGLIFKP